jgi:ribosomal protein L11 methyltransferase
MDSGRDPAEPKRYPYVHVDVPAGQAEDVSAELWELGASGIEERDAATLTTPDGPDGGRTLVASFAEEDQARDVAEHLQQRFAARLQFVVGDEWREGWRRFFKPVRLGGRLVVRPSWEPLEPWPGEVVLTLDPGNAFGSGTHATTQLVLREVDRHVWGAEQVLDVGCGSGILSVAALLLGAEHAEAVDVDRDAVIATRENAELNDATSRLTVSDTPLEQIRGQYDLVCANIETSVLIDAAGALSARVKPGGTLVLSGLLVRDRDRVREAYPELKLRTVPRSGDWLALVLHKPEHPAES